MPSHSFIKNFYAFDPKPYILRAPSCWLQALLVNLCIRLITCSYLSKVDRLSDQLCPRKDVQNRTIV